MGHPSHVLQAEWCQRGKNVLSEQRCLYSVYFENVHTLSFLSFPRSSSTLSTCYLSIASLPALLFLVLQALPKSLLLNPILSARMRDGLGIKVSCTAQSASALATVTARKRSHISTSGRLLHKRRGLRVTRHRSSVRRPTSLHPFSPPGTSIAPSSVVHPDP